MSNYNKVKNEGMEAIKKINLAGLDRWQEEELKSFLSTFTDKVKEAVLEDESEEIKHDYKKLLDGFAHPKDCEMCRAESSLKP